MTENSDSPQSADACIAQGVTNVPQTAWTKFRSILEMIRFSHTLFALPFALLAAAMAWASPIPFSLQGRVDVGFSWWHLVGVLICMLGARSAGMAFNRLVDRHIDGANPRTANRHLPAGELSVAAVTWFTLVSVLVFVVGTAFFLPNWLPVAFSLPVLGILMGYSYTKRFTPLAHYWLGVALMLSPICVWVALRGQIVIAMPADLLPALVLGLAVFFWVGGFDVIYACQDYEYDKQVGLRSIPVWLGVAGALRWAALSHFAAFLALLMLPSAYGSDSGLGWLYYTAVAAIGALLVYEHRLVNPNDLSKVNLAFFNVNAIISIGLLMVGLVDLYLL